MGNEVLRRGKDGKGAANAIHDGHKISKTEVSGEV